MHFWCVQKGQLQIIPRIKTYSSSLTNSVMPLAIMRFAVNKHWLKSDIQKMVWQYSFETPSAKVMKGVSIQSFNYQNRWPRKRLTTKSGVHAKVAMGRSMVNPCHQCEMAENFGSNHDSGGCRSRPVVMRSLYEDSYLGGSTPQCRDESPRRCYLKKLRRQADMSKMRAHLSP